MPRDPHAGGIKRFENSALPYAQPIPPMGRGEKSVHLLRVEDIREASPQLRRVQEFRRVLFEKTLTHQKTVKGPQCHKPPDDRTLDHDPRTFVRRLPDLAFRRAKDPGDPEGAQALPLRLVPRGGASRQVREPGRITPAEVGALPAGHA